MDLFRNLKVGAKLTLSFLVVVFVLAIGTGVGVSSLKSINDSNFILYSARSLPIQVLGEVSEALSGLPGYIFKFLTIPQTTGKTAVQIVLSNPPRCTSCHSIEVSDEKHGSTTSTGLVPKDCTACHTAEVNAPAHGQAANKTIQASDECLACHSDAVILRQKADTEQVIRDDMALVNTKITDYRRMNPNLTSDEQAQLNEFGQLWGAYQITINDMLDKAKAGSARESLHRLVGGDGFQNHKDSEAAIQKLISLDQNLAKDAQNTSSATFWKAVELLVLTGLAGILLAIGLGLYLSRSVTGPLQQLTLTSRRIADINLQALATQIKALAHGDLTGQIEISAQTQPVTSNDEIGELAQAFNEMTVRMQEIGRAFSEMTSGLRNLVYQVSENASALSQASGHVAVSANLSAAAVQDAAHVTHQLNTAIQQVSDTAQAQVRSAADSVHATQTSAMTVNATIQSMRTIQTKVGQAAEKVAEMGQRSEQIGTIISTIQEIATKSRLLALNATIEAARAGEHGKGFAVVANEVRDLAADSAEATRKISALVEAIQVTVADVVTAMNENAGEADHGVMLASEAEQVMRSVLQAVEFSQQTGDEITAASNQMSRLAEDLVSAVESVSAVVDPKTAAAGGSAVHNTRGLRSSSQSLAAMAHTLRELVSQFRISDQDQAPASIRPEENRRQAVHKSGWAYKVPLYSGLLILPLIVGIMAWNRPGDPLQLSQVFQPTATETSQSTTFATEKPATPILAAFTPVATATAASTPTAGRPAIFLHDVPFVADVAGSAHANADAQAFTHWDEATPAVIPVTCAKCHSAAGYLDFLGADGSAAGKVESPAAIGSVITCSACHNSATPALSAVTFPSGTVIRSLGAEAICMNCHQGRESMSSLEAAIQKAKATGEDTPNKDLAFINLHYAAAAATQYGGLVHSGYEYAGKTYSLKPAHAKGYTTCVGCHDPHNLKVKVSACQTCHSGVTGEDTLKNIRKEETVDYNGNGDSAEGIAYEIIGLQDKLLQAIQAYAATVIQTPVAYSAKAHPYFFIDTNHNGQVDPDEANAKNAFNAWTPRLLKAAYNYQMAIKDPGAFAHNGQYMLELLYDSTTDLNSKLAKPVDLTKAKR